MTPDHALALLTTLIQVTFVIAGPLLVASLLGGLLVGVIQTATQINEASIGYVVKAIAIVLVLLLFGPNMSERAVSYARSSFQSIETVVQ